MEGCLNFRLAIHKKEVSAPIMLGSKTIEGHLSGHFGDLDGKFLS